MSTTESMILIRSTITVRAKRIAKSTMSLPRRSRLPQETTQRRRGQSLKIVKM
jgi:hypothetical protein